MASLQLKSNLDAAGLGLGGVSPSSDAANNVRVCLRVRPLLPFEKNAGDSVNAAVLSDGRTVRLTSNQATYNQQVEAHQYRLDQCFGPDANQQAFFHGSGVEAFCDSALEGQSATVFCFGQTGSGKTFTMSGPHLADDIDQYFSRELKRKEGIALGGGIRDGELPEDVHMETAGLQYRGVHYIASAAARANAEILRRAAENGDETNFTPITIRASYLEIYQENVNDLLNETEGLKVRWAQGAQSFFVENLLIVTCDDVGDLMAVLAQGGGNRKRAAHKLNVDSSRSHVLFTLYIERRDRADAPAKYGKINFVDLAGSEKLKDSESTGVNADETKSINTSLFTLGKVIAALSKRRTIQKSPAGVVGPGGVQVEEEVFVPYRDSALTKLLMDSLGGNCRTLMIACISPAFRFTDESVRTIKYAMRTRNIVNAIPTVRMDPGQRQVFELKQEVAMLKKENQRLREELALFRGGGQPPSYGGSSQHTPVQGHLIESYRTGGVGGGQLPDSAPGNSARLPAIPQPRRPSPHTTTYIEEDHYDKATSRVAASNGTTGPRNNQPTTSKEVSPSPHSPPRPPVATNPVPPTLQHLTRKRPLPNLDTEPSQLPPLSPSVPQVNGPPPSVRVTHKSVGTDIRDGEGVTAEPAGMGPSTPPTDSNIIIGAEEDVDPATFTNRRQLGGRLPKPSGTATTILASQRNQQFPATQDHIDAGSLEQSGRSQIQRSVVGGETTLERTPPPLERNEPRGSRATPTPNGERGQAHSQLSTNSDPQQSDSRKPSSSDVGTRDTAAASLNPDGSVKVAAWSSQPTTSAKDAGKRFGFKPAKKK